MKLRDESKPVRNFPSYKPNPHNKDCRQCGAKFYSPLGLFICQRCVSANNDESIRASMAAADKQATWNCD